MVFFMSSLYSGYLSFFKMKTDSSVAGRSDESELSLNSEADKIPRRNETATAYSSVGTHLDS